MHIIRLPRLGQTMESGVITLWHYLEGDTVDSGQPLYEVETEKSATDVEVRQSGVLVRIVAPVGAEVPVGAVLAVVAEAGEAPAASAVDDLLTAAGSEGAPEEPGEGEGSFRDEQEEPVHLPGRSAEATGYDGAEPAIASKDRRPRAVPKARVMAKELGVDLSIVHGSGVDGVVRVSDVHSSFTGSGPTSPTRDASGVERSPLEGVARAMAAAVTRSWREIPQFVQMVSIDATALVARQKRFKFEGAGVTYTDLLIAATAAAVLEVPEVNVSFRHEEVLRYREVHVSIAVASDRGLVVPVVRAAHCLTVEEIARVTKELAQKARDGKLTRADTSDGTITVSNLGAFGIDTGTPMVNHPQAAIVFVGSLSDQVVVRDGNVVIRPILNVSVAFDHRVIDGMTGARFTSALKRRLEAGG